MISSYPLTLGHCLWPSPSEPTVEICCFFQDTLRNVTLGNRTDTAGLESDACRVHEKRTLPDGFCLFSLHVRSSGVTHTTLVLKGIGFLPGRVWSASSSFCYQATLITNSSAPFTPKSYLVGRLVLLSGRKGQEFLALRQSSSPRGLPEEGLT